MVEKEGNIRVRAGRHPRTRSINVVRFGKSAAVRGMIEEEGDVQARRDARLRTLAHQAGCSV